MKVAFLVRSMEDSSSRYRALQYVPFLKEKGVDVSVLCHQRRWGDKLKLYNSMDRYDIVVIFRKRFTPIEFWYIRRKARKIIYDLDDAVMYRDSGSASPRSFSRRLRFSYMMRRVDAVIAGNDFLKSEVLRYNDRVVTIPTTIDLSRYSMKGTDGSGNHMTIGWIGSNSTLEYLKLVIPAIERIYQRHPDVRFKIVCETFLDNLTVPVIKKRWTSEEEGADLRSFDIGVMPLEDDLWSRGKCALKILQYYGVGLPVVCSPVGTNREIVKDGINGFWARDEKEWEEKLETLIEKEDLRREMGARGRSVVEQEYSLEVNAPHLLAVLKEVMGRG